MASTLTRNDLQQWLQKTSYASSQKPENIRVGLAGDLFETSLQLITSLLELAKEKDLIPSQIIRSCRNEIERYHLWGDGFGVAEGDLDILLDKSSDLKVNVISLLHKVGSVVSHGFCKALKANVGSDKIGSQQKELDLHLGSAEAMLAERSSFDADLENESFSDSDISEEDFSELLDEVALYTDCLMDLTPALENPALDVLALDKEAVPTETFKASSALTLTFCRRIRDLFPPLPVKLVERFAEANNRRSQRIQSQIRDASEPALTRRETKSATSSEPTFSETGPDYSVTTKSSFVSSSVFDEMPAPQEKANELDDNASQTTFASFSTSFSVDDRLGRPRVPPLPDGAAQGKAVECIACNKEVNNVRTRQAWKRHVFNDLQPYVCTNVECEHLLLLFSSRKRFAEHEKSHGITEPLRACPFCPNERDKIPQIAYFKHVGRHLQEVCLAVLPRIAGSEASSESLASKGDSSTRSSQSMTRDEDNLGAGVFSSEKPFPSPDPRAEHYEAKVRLPPAPVPESKQSASQNKQSLQSVKGNPDIQPCNYKTGKTLGVGSVSVVKECVNINTGLYFATKVTSKKLIGDRKEHVRANIAILKTISTNHVLEFVDYFETLNNLYLVFALATGGTLYDRVRQRGTYSEWEGAAVVSQLLSALKYLHDQGIAHNRVLPESVLYKAPEDTQIVLASLAYLQYENKVVPLDNEEAPRNLAPEEVTNPLNVIRSSRARDIWGVGILTHFVHSGSDPIDRGSRQDEMDAVMRGDVKFRPDHLWAPISVGAMDFIRHCLRVDPRRRPTAEEAMQYSWLSISKPDHIEAQNQGLPYRPSGLIETLKPPPRDRSGRSFPPFREPSRDRTSRRSRHRVDDRDEMLEARKPAAPRDDY